MIWKHRKHYFEKQEDVSEIPICYELVSAYYFTPSPPDYPEYTVSWKECGTLKKGFLLLEDGDTNSIKLCILLSSLGGDSTLNRYATMPTEAQVMDAITNNYGEIIVPIYDTTTNLIVGSLKLIFDPCGT